MSEIVERAVDAILDRAPVGMTAAQARSYAIAVLEAAREPTPEMTKAAHARYQSGHLKTAWRLMIDAALK